jgi:SMODS-associated and fused to various effectors sensor domain
MSKPKVAQQIENSIPTGRHKRPKAAVERELWARSAGVCQFPGCADVLYRDMAVYWESINLGELAHNVAASARGPRGDSVRSATLSDDSENLLMLCRKHHKTADALPREYRESTLRRWKERHEAAVLHAAQLTRGEAMYPLIAYASQIGGHPVQIEESATIRAILNEGAVPTAKPYPLKLDTHAQLDNEPAYWSSQVNRLRDDLRLCLTLRQRDNADATIGLFALAEMPALIALGHALGDKAPLRIYQFSRHIGSWEYQNPGQESPPFTYTVPETIGPAGVSVVVSLTAPIESERILTVVTDDSIPIIHFTTPKTSTELVQSAETIDAFRKAFRQCLNDIEALAPRTAPIHLFPCLPASLAVALGCCIMPKVANPIVVYDAKGGGGEFRRCLELPLPLTADNKLSTDRQL